MNKNNWIYTTKGDKVRFYSTVFLVSCVFLGTFILLQELSSAFIYFFRFQISDLNEMALDERLTILAHEKLFLLENFMMIFGSVITFTAAAIMLKLIHMRTQKGRTDDRITFSIVFPHNFIQIIIIVVAVYYLSINAANYFDFKLEESGFQKEIYENFPIPNNIASMLLHILSIAVAPAVTEEIVFRGLALNILRKYGNAFAIITTSLFFGFIHASTNAFFFATAFGLMSAFIAIKTKSVVPSIVLHFIINCISVVLEYFSGFVYEETLLIVYLICESVLFLAGGVLMVKYLTKKYMLKLYKTRNSIDISKKMKIISFLNPASVIFFIIVISYAAQAYIM